MKYEKSSDGVIGSSVITFFFAQCRFQRPTQPLGQRRIVVDRVGAFKVFDQWFSRGSCRPRIPLWRSA